VVQLFDNDTGQPLGTITDAQLDVLTDLLEEESADDTDYYINLDTLDLLAERGADAGLVALLRNALGDRQEMEIRWDREH
jgi:hypothetical protein